MKNVNIKEIGNKITIEIDKTLSFGETSSKKSIMVASSGGFVALPSGIKVSVNAVKEKETANGKA